MGHEGVVLARDFLALETRRQQLDGLQVRSVESIRSRQAAEQAHRTSSVGALEQRVARHQQELVQSAARNQVLREQALVYGRQAATQRLEGRAAPFGAETLERVHDARALFTQQVESMAGEWHRQSEAQTRHDIAATQQDTIRYQLRQQEMLDAAQRQELMLQELLAERKRMMDERARFAALSQELESRNRMLRDQLDLQQGPDLQTVGAPVRQALPAPVAAHSQPWQSHGDPTRGVDVSAPRRGAGTSQLAIQCSGHEAPAQAVGGQPVGGLSVAPEASRWHPPEASMLTAPTNIGFTPTRSSPMPEDEFGFKRRESYCPPQGSRLFEVYSTLRNYEMEMQSDLNLLESAAPSFPSHLCSSLPVSSDNSLSIRFDAPHRGPLIIVPPAHHQPAVRGSNSEAHSEKLISAAKQSPPHHAHEPLSFPTPCPLLSRATQHSDAMSMSPAADGANYPLHASQPVSIPTPCPLSSRETQHSDAMSMIPAADGALYPSHASQPVCTGTPDDGRRNLTIEGQAHSRMSAVTEVLAQVGAPEKVTGLSQPESSSAVAAASALRSEDAVQAPTQAADPEGLNGRLDRLADLMNYVQAPRQQVEMPPLPSEAVPSALAESVAASFALGDRLSGEATLSNRPAGLDITDSSSSSAVAAGPKMTPSGSRSQLMNATPASQRSSLPPRSPGPPKPREQDDCDAINFDHWIPDSTMGSSPSSAQERRSFAFDADATPSALLAASELSKGTESGLRDSERYNVGDIQHATLVSTSSEEPATPNQLGGTSRLGSTFGLSPTVGDASHDKHSFERASPKGATLLSDTLSISGSIQGESRSSLFNRHMDVLGISPTLDLQPASEESPHRAAGYTAPSVMDLNGRFATASAISNHTAENNSDQPQTATFTSDLHQGAASASGVLDTIAGADARRESDVASADPSHVAPSAGWPQERLSPASPNSAVAFSFGRASTGAGVQPQKHAVPWQADSSLAVNQDLPEESGNGDVEESDALIAVAYSFGGRASTGAGLQAQKHAVPWRADSNLSVKQDLPEESESGDEESDALMAVAHSFGGRASTGAGLQAQKHAVPWQADSNLSVKQDLSFESESGDLEESLMARLGMGAMPKAQAARPTKGVGIGGAPTRNMMRDLGLEESESADLNQSLEPPSGEGSSSMSKTPKRSNPLARGTGRGLGLGLSGKLGGSGSSELDQMPGARSLAKGSLGLADGAKENRPSLSGVSSVMQRFTGKAARPAAGFGNLNLDELRQSTW